MKAFILKDTAIKGRCVAAGTVQEVGKEDFDALRECKKAELFDATKHQPKKG